MNNETIQAESATSWCSEELAFGETIDFDAAHDVESDIIVTVVETVADLTDQQAITMQPLYEAIDPGSLAELMMSSRSRGQSLSVTFSYQGCSVTVSSSGDVTAAPDV